MRTASAIHGWELGGYQSGKDLRRSAHTLAEVLGAVDFLTQMHPKSQLQKNTREPEVESHHARRETKWTKATKKPKPICSLVMPWHSN